MKSTKKILALILCAVMLLSLCACGKASVEKTSAEEKPLVEQIDEQLAGTWVSYNSDTVMSKWTFHDGKYVVDTYVDGNKIDNSTVGTYTIGSDAIHTLTADQKITVEGSIPFTFENGILVLNGAVGTLEKE